MDSYEIWVFVIITGSILLLAAWQMRDEIRMNADRILSGIAVVATFLLASWLSRQC